MVNVRTNLVQGGFNISVDGADQVMKAIRAVAPDLDKNLKDKLKTIGQEIVVAAKQRVPSESPLSNWEYVPKADPNWATKWNARERGLRVRAGGFPQYAPGKIKSGIRSQIGKPKGARHGGVLYVKNVDPAGSIFEVAGRKNDPFNASGRNFIRVLNQVDRASRVIWDAFDDLGRTQIQQRVLDAVREAEAELQRRLGGDGFVETSR